MKILVFILFLSLFQWQTCNGADIKRHWLAERVVIDVGERVLLDSKYIPIASESFALSIRLAPLDDAKANAFSPGDIVILAYAKSPLGNHIFVKKLLPQPFDGDIMFLDRFPAVSDSIKIVLFSRAGITESVVLTAVVIDK